MHERGASEDQAGDLPGGRNPTARSTPRRISLRRRVLFCVVIVLASLFALEGGLRLTGRPRGLVRTFSGVWNRDQASLARAEGLFVPSARRRIAWPPQLAYEVGFNAHGLRGPELLATLPPLRVLALGDSVTFGYYCADDETWPAQLEAKLRGEGLAAEVVNAGCGHFTITDELRYLRERLLRLEPDVVVLQFCSNDVLDAELGRTPTLYEGLLREAEAPEGPGDWLRQTALGEVQLELALRLKALRREPPTAMADPQKPIPDTAWTRYEAELLAMRDLLRARGIDLVMVGFPDLATVQADAPSSYDERLAQICRRVGVPFHSALAEMRTASDDARTLYHWPHDPHPSARGNEALALAAHAVLRDAGLLRPRR